MGNMKIGLLSFIDIYSGGGIKVINGRSFSGVSTSHYETKLRESFKREIQVVIWLAFFLFEKAFAIVRV
jgi:hypothetical protein